VSYATEKEKKLSDKVVLVELDIGRKQQNWLNYCAGIWYYRFNSFTRNQDHSFGYGNFLFGPFLSSEKMDSGIIFNPFDVGSCFVDGEEYVNEVSSIVNLISTNKSWYYDRNETEFYLHIDKFGDPRLHRVLLGITIALSNKAKHINGGFYEPRVKGIFVIDKSKDPLEFGVIRFDGGNLTLNNEDGFFDSFTRSIIFGQPVVTRYGIDGFDGTEMDYADYKKIATTYIEDISIGWKHCTLSLIDYRKKLSRKLPIHNFDKNTYPYLADKNEGKPVPLGYGTVYNQLVICTNEEEPSPANYSFKVCDISDHPYGIKDIIQVYVGGAKVTHSNENITDATFTLSSTDYSPGKKVTCDYEGYVNGSSDLIENSLDVLEDLLYVYLDIAYNSTNYDTAEWAAIKSSTKNIGFSINDYEEINCIISNIALSNFANFIIRDDGRYTFRILDRAAAAEETVYLDEYFDEPVIEYAGSRFLSSVKIGYAKDYENKEYRWYVKDDLEAEIVAEYKKHRSIEPETYLVNETDAQWLAEKYMDLMRSVRGIITTRTGVQNNEFEIGDIKNLVLDRRDRGWEGSLKTEIIGLQKDLLGTGKVTIKGLVLVD